MSNVAHSTLTGANLHENAGVAAASSNTVATASSGSTVWKKLDNTNLGPTANPFGAALLYVREEQTSGTGSSTVITGSVWSTIVLNTTKTNEVSSASLSSNQISLPAGTYWVDAKFNLYTSSGSGNTSCYGKLRLQNITDTLEMCVGQTVAAGAPVGQRGGTQASLNQRFTIAGTKTLELQFFGSSGVVPPINASSSNEVYGELMIWKIA